MSDSDKQCQCPKCGFTSGNDWKQCQGSCPVSASPHYSAKPDQESSVSTRRLDRFIPDAEDLEAQHEVGVRFFDRLAKRSLPMSAAERDLFLFDSGWIRGAQWMQRKMQDDQNKKRLVMKRQQ